MQNMAYPRQICKFQNDRLVLEFNDKLFPAPPEYASNLHAGYSKIYVVGIDTSNGKGPDAIVSDCNLDPIKVKRLYEKVLFFNPQKTTSGGPTTPTENGNRGGELTIGFGPNAKLTPSQMLAQKGNEGVEELRRIQELLRKNESKYPVNSRKIAEIETAIQKFQNGETTEPPAPPPASTGDAQESVVLLREQKINPNAANPANGNEYKVTNFLVEFNPRMRSPWTVSIENGWGQLERRQNGGFNIKKGSYRKEKAVKAFIEDEKFREMIRECNDYIMHFEQCVFAELMRQRNEFEEQQKQK
jgi:hypothetical protein